MSKSNKNKTIQETSTIQEFPDGKIVRVIQAIVNLLLSYLGRNYDATAVRSIAQDWIDKHMKNRSVKFIHIFVFE